VKMDKRILIGVFVILGFSVLIGLWQMGFFKGRPRATCDPPPGSFGSFKWTEALMSTDGSFYFKLVNPNRQTQTITNISIRASMPDNITYIVETPLPSEVKGREGVLVSGKYKPVGSIKEQDEYRYLVHMTYTHTVITTVIEDEVKRSMWGKVGIIERPEPC